MFREITPRALIEIKLHHGPGARVHGYNRRCNSSLSVRLIDRIGMIRPPQTKRRRPALGARYGHVSCGRDEVRKTGKDRDRPQVMKSILIIVFVVCSVVKTTYVKKNKALKPFKVIINVMVNTIITELSRLKKRIYPSITICLKKRTSPNNRLFKKKTHGCNRCVTPLFGVAGYFQFKFS